MTKRVVIVGGGISGLAAAHTLQKLRPDLELRLLEASSRLGGNVGTDSVDGFVVEHGPDSFVVSKPHALELCRELDLQQELIATPPQNRVVFFAQSGHLVPLPEGLVLGVPTRFLPLLMTPLLSVAGKLRALWEPFVAVRSNSEDESIHDFFARRLGPEIAERIADPLIGGIYAGDPRQLSLAATFPQFRAFEQRYGSLILGMHLSRAAPSQAPPQGWKRILSLLSMLLPRARSDAPAFLSLRAGMQTLIDRLSQAMPEQSIALGSAVSAVTPQPSSANFPLRVQLASGASLDAHAVLLASSVPQLAKIVSDPELQLELGAIHTTSTATVVFGFERARVAHSLHGVGFVVPRGEGQILAATWSSSKWPHRAPDDKVLLRAFVSEAHATQDDQALAELARSELVRLMGALGEPVFTRVYRYLQSSPQPELGHPERMRRVHARLEAVPGLFLSAGGLDGIGLPDSIRYAKQAAERIASLVK